jgi:hypothetical protein
MPEARVAVLAQEPTNASVTVIVVDDRCGTRLTDQTFTVLSGETTGKLTFREPVQVLAILLTLSCE